MSFNTPGHDAPFLYKLLLSHLGGGGRGGQENRVRLKNQRVMLALVQILLICAFHFIGGLEVLISINML